MSRSDCRIQTTQSSNSGCQRLTSLPTVITARCPGGIATCCRARCQSCTNSGAYRRNCSPAGVSEAPVLSRMNRGRPSSCSRRRIRALTVVWPTLSRSEARMKLPVETISRKVLASSMFMDPFSIIFAVNPPCNYVFCLIVSFRNSLHGAGPATPGRDRETKMSLETRCPSGPPHRRSVVQPAVVCLAGSPGCGRRWLKISERFPDIRRQACHG